MTGEGRLSFFDLVFKLKPLHIYIFSFGITF